MSAPKAHSKVNAFLPKTESARAAEDQAKLAKAIETRADQERAASTKGASEPVAPSRGFFGRRPGREALFGGRSRRLGTRFNRCVKSVRSKVTARRGSTKEGAAIAICTTSILYPRGRTLKRYRKGRLVTQRRLR
jgi:hypothetical protein